MARKKKKQFQPIPDETWTRWCDITAFFEDMTNEKTFKEQEIFFKDVELVNSDDDIILCCGRGCGKTWSLAIVALWYSFVFASVQHQPICVAVLAGSKDESKILFKYLRRILKGHDVIDQYIAQNQRGGLRFTRDYIEFKDGSSIEALPCSLTGVCGPRANLLIIDEAGLKDFNEDVKDEAFEIITGQRWARIIMASTPYYYRSPFVKTYLMKKGWRKHHWGQPDCPWIRKNKIESKRENYSSMQFDIRVLGKPSPLEGGMFDHKKLKKVLHPFKEIHYADYAAIVAGLDVGQNIAETALTIIEINPVDKKIRVKFYKTWKNPDHSEIIPPILQLCESYGVTKILCDASPPSATAMLKKEAKFTTMKIEPISFTHGTGDAMYHNLVRLVEKELIEIPHDYTGKMNTLTEQMREMQWTKNPKKRTDLVDALALACSETSSFLAYKKIRTDAAMMELIKEWRKGMEGGRSTSIVPLAEEEKEVIEYPKELQGDENTKIWYMDPVFGDLRIMSKREAKEIWRSKRGKRRRRKIISIRRGRY